MKLLKIINFIFWFPSVSSAKANESAITIQNRINAIEKIHQNTFWRNEIESQQILMDTKLMVIDYTRTFQNVPKEPTSDVAKLEVDKVHTFLFNNSKTMYAALKCKYSDLIINTFHFYYDCLTACGNLTAAVPQDRNDSSELLAQKSKKKKEKCVASVTRLVTNHKPYISKIIFELMYFIKLSPSLRSTDHTLIKSLMSANLFLHHAIRYTDENGGREKSGKEEKAEKKNGPDEWTKHEKHREDEDDDAANAKLNTEIDMKKVIGQLLNAVERYSHKHCDDARRFYDLNVSLSDHIHEMSLQGRSFYAGIRELPAPATKGFETLFGNVRVESVEELMIPRFAAMDTMYDPRRLLLKDVFEMDGCRYAFFGTLRVRWRHGGGEWTPLRHVCEQAESGRDLSTTFDYQVLLLEVIKDMFYVKLINGHARGDRAAVLQLIDTFGRFVDDVLPANYPTDVYVPIAELRNSLRRDTAASGGDAVLSDSTLALLVGSPVINTWGASNDTDRLLDAVDMSEFVRAVTALETFNHFVQVFELLSYESYALDEYLLRGVAGHGQEATAAGPSSGNGETCGRLGRLRECFVAFQLLMDAFVRVSGQHSVISDQIRESAELAVVAVRRVIVSFYAAYAQDDRIARILLPLVVRFPRAFGDVQPAKFRFLRQTAASALNALERYELHGCAAPHRYNRDMWRDMWRDVSGDDGKLCAGPWSPALMSAAATSAAVHLPFVFRCRRPLTREIEARAIAAAGGRPTDDRWTRFLSGIVIELVVPVPGAVHRDNDGDFWTQYVWDGSRVFVEDAYDEMRCSAVPLDYGHLVTFQLFEMKWMVSRVFKKLLFVLAHRDRLQQLSAAGTTSFERDVKRFLDLPWPDSIGAHVRSALHLFPEAVAAKRDARTADVDAFLRQINTFGMSTEDFTSSYRELSAHFSLPKLYESLHADVENAKFILQYMDEHGSNFIENLPFSSIL